MSIEYWNKLGIAFPEGMNDDEADKLIQLILGSLEMTWEEKRQKLMSLMDSNPADLRKFVNLLLAQQKLEARNESNGTRRARAKSDIEYDELRLKFLSRLKEVEFSLGKSEQDCNDVACLLCITAILALLDRSLPSSGLDEYEEKRANAHKYLGEIQGKLGYLGQALIELQTAKRLFESSPLRDRSELDETRVNLHLNLGLAYQLLEQSKKATSSYRVALSLLELPHLVQRVDLNPSRAHGHRCLADLYNERDNLDEALSHYEAALGFFQTLALSQDFLFQIAETQNNHGVLLSRLEQYANATNSFGEAIRIYSQINDSTDAVERLVGSYINRGSALGYLDRSYEAIESIDAALNLIEQTTDIQPHRNFELRIQALMFRADLFEKLEKWDMAVSDYTALLKVLVQNSIEPVGELASTLLEVHIKLKDIYLDQHNYELAEQYIRGSISVLENSPHCAGCKFDGLRGLCQKELAHVLEYLGKTTEQEIALREAIKFLELTHLRARKDVGLDSSLAQTYHNLGTILQDTGRLNAAIHHYKAANDLRKQLHLQAEGESDVEIDRAGTFVSHANTLRKLGEFDLTLTYHGLAIEILDRLASEADITDELDFTRLIDIRSSAYMGMGNALKELGELDDSVSCYHQALRICDNPKFDEDDALDYLRAMIYSNLGNAYSLQARTLIDQESHRLAREKLLASIDNFQESLALHDWPHLRAQRELDTHRASVYLNFGSTLFDLACLEGKLCNEVLAQNFLVQSYSAHSTALGILDSSYFQPRREWDDLRSLAHTNIGNCNLLYGHKPAACSAYKKSEALLFDPAGIGDWRHLDGDRFRLFTRMSRVLSEMEDPHSWSSEKSLWMVEALELVPEVAGGAFDARDEWRHHFVRFHAHWIQFCIERGEFERLPGILAAIQGRELAARLLDELDALGDRDETPEAIVSYQKLRLELRKVRAGIQAIVGDGGGGSPGSDGRLSGGAARAPMAPGAAERLEALQAEDARLYEQLPAAREVAAKEPGYEALLVPHQVSTEALLRGLDDDEALVVLLDLQSDIDIEGALVVRQGKKPFQWCPLPGLREDARAVDRFSMSLGHASRGWRDAGVAASDADGEEELLSPEEVSGFWPDMEARMADELWGRLGEALGSIGKVVCITQGLLHLLPLDAGVPADVSLSHYPGFVFFGHHRSLFGKRGEKCVSEGSLKAIALAAWPGPDGDIPYTEGERSALEHLHRTGPFEVVSDNPFAMTLKDRPLALDLLHLACHGAPDARGRVVLHLGHDMIVDMARVMETAFTVRQVLIMACLGGRVRESLDGEPSGVAGGFLYGGSEQVAAALVSIDDGWAMLTGILVHQAWLESGDLAWAVTEAKRRLKMGDWYEETQELFVSAASMVTLKSQLETMLRIGDANGWRRTVQPLEDVKLHWSAALEKQAQDLGTVLPGTIPKELDEIQTQLGAEAYQAMISSIAGYVAQSLVISHNPSGEDLPLHPAITDILVSRIPPQPHLGNLTHGLRVFGKC